MSKHPETDLEEVIVRLRNELSRIIARENNIKRLISSDAEFDGLTVIGGITTILKRLHEEQDKNRELETELRKHIIKG